MNRHDRFKTERVMRRKLSLTLFFCCVMLVTGMCVVDYSNNILIMNKAEFGIVAVHNYKTYLEVSILNEKLYFNTKYISRDIEQLTKLLDRKF